jgi:phage repressor protein C with HTH and peptisase S24 domain
VAFLKKNATYLTVRIKGDSMAPTLQDSGYAIIRLLDKSEWAKMPDERIYAIGDVDGKVYLKRVKNRFKQDFIVLMSDNPDKASNPNFNLMTAEINTIWYMEWYFSAKLPNIHDQYYSRLKIIEDKVDDLVKKLK